MSTGAVSPQQPAVPLRQRLNIDEMTAEQLADFRDAMSASMGSAMTAATTTRQGSTDSRCRSAATSPTVSQSSCLGIARISTFSS